MSKVELFRKRSDPESRQLRAWHRYLLDQRQRGERSRLRRRGTIEEAALDPGFHTLLHWLGVVPDRLSPEQLEGLAALAVVAAAVDEDLPERRLGLSLGKQPGKDQAEVSEGRFRRLLESEELKKRFEVLRRLVALLGKSADLFELAGVLLNWEAHRRRQLAYDYYNGFAGTSAEAATPVFATPSAIEEEKIP